MTSPAPEERPTAPATPAPAPLPPAPAQAYTPPAAAANPGPAPVPAALVPVPPRSRIGAHVLSVLVGLVLTPVALGLLASGAQGVVGALEEAGQAAVPSIASAAVGALLLGVVAVTAAGSTLGPMIGGALYGVAPGIGFLVSPETITDQTSTALDQVEPVTGTGLTTGALILGSTGSLVVLGLSLVLVGVATHLARRAGKRSERVEAALVAASQPDPTQAGGAPIVPPTPPHSRVAAHLGSAALGLLVTPVGLALVAAGAVDLALAYADVEQPAPGALIWPWGVGLVLVALVVVSAGWSSLGLLVGGALFGLLPGALGLVTPDWADRGIARVMTWLGDAVDPDAGAGLYALVTTGIILAWGAIATFGAIGAHAARKDGRRRERAELAVARGAAAAR